MTSRWFRSSDLEHARGRGDELDPVKEGNRYNLEPHVSQAIWRRVCLELKAGFGARDEHEARARFHDEAKRVEARGGSLLPAPGRGDWDASELIGYIAPGKLIRADVGPRSEPSVSRSFHSEAAHASERAQQCETSARPPLRSPEAREQDSLASGVAPMSTKFRTRGLGEVVGALARSARSTNNSTAILASTPETSLWQIVERRAATLYRQAIDAGEVRADDPAVEQALARLGGGQALSDEVRLELELELGVSLARVRVHTDAVAAEAARTVRAEAFTVGEDIYFAAGAFAPDTRRGKKLLAHELAHVAQALRGRILPAGNELRVSQAGEPLEQEAEAVAERVAAATSLHRERSQAGELEVPRSSAAAPAQRVPVAPVAPSALLRAPLVASGPDPMWQEMFSGDSVEVGKLGRVQAPLGIYLKARPAPHASKVSLLLKFDTKVFVVRSTPQADVAQRWAYVTVAGDPRSGFIEERYLAVGPPDPAAKLHRVTPGERLGQIAADEFGVELIAGNDARLFVQAIYEANKGRAGIRLDSVKLPRRQSVPREQAEEETLEIYKGVKVIEGQAIWIPSKELVQQLKASGTITSGSTELSKGWRAGKDYASDVVDVAKLEAGYVVGILQGAYEAVRDIFGGAVDLLRMAFEIVKARITGHLLELAIDAAKKLKEVIVQLPDVAKALGSYVAGRWTSAGPFGKGQFVGEVVGYVAANVLLALATGGGAVAVMLARAAESGSQIARAVMLLVKVADAAANPLKLLEGAGKSAAISEEAAARLKQALARDGAAASKAERTAASTERGVGQTSKTAGGAEHGKHGPEIQSGVSEAPDPLLRGGQLSQRQIELDKKLVAAADKMITIGKREVTATDLAALTKASGVEHAIVILHDDTRALIRMESYAGGQLPSNTKRLLMHSHPEDWGSGMAKFISAADIEAIITLKQEYSYMVTVDGTVYKFTTKTMPMSIGEVVRQFHPMHGWVGQ